MEKKKTEKAEKTEAGAKTLYLTQALQRTLYGPRALATVVIRGTSLIFELTERNDKGELERGRSTLPPQSAQSAATGMPGSRPPE